MTKGENENRSSEARLLAIGETLSDGGDIDWDAASADTPTLTTMLRRLQQLQTIGRVHASVAPRRCSDASDSTDGRNDEAARPCPFDWGALRVIEHVGRGSFGDVYRALEPRLQREVALKLRRVEAMSDAPEDVTSARRFLDEARNLARIRHPNVVAVHGADVVNGQAGFWTDFVHGKTVASYLGEKGVLSHEEAARIGLDLCRALGAVHAVGLVHGDIKAANAMREPDGRILLMDFGASSWERHARGSDDATVAVIGSPLSMAPELLVGEAPSTASDLYSLGVLLHLLMSGHYPYVGDSLRDLHDAHERGARVPMAVELPAGFSEVLERALERDPLRRYRSAAEMEEALRTVIEGPAAAKHHTLPAEPDTFIGRDDDLAALGRRFASGARLVTAFGTAGTGKTRLAVRWGWQELARWPGGVWFCDLRAAKSIDGVVSAVRGSLEVPLGTGDPVVQLGRALAARGSCLVILDNVEQVVEAIGTCTTQWMELAPEACFLLTSRERLNVRGESVQLVEPLSMESGLMLFAERARGQVPSFEFGDLGGVTTTAIRELVRLLEGIPLAIELAAARMRAMTPAELLGRMHDRLRLLSRGVRGDDRHRTLRAAIDGSWELLRPWEQAAFAQCSVFEGGFTLEAAESVLDLSAWPEAPWAVDVIQSLADKSLLRTVRGEGLGQTGEQIRFGMFVSLQEYARVQLALLPGATAGGGSSALRDAEERHGRYYAALDDAGVRRGRSLELEVADLVAACRRARDRGDVHTAVNTHRLACEVFARHGPLGAGVDLGRDLLEGMQLEPRARTRILTTLGQAEWHSGQMAQGLRHLEEALVLVEELCDRQLERAVRGSLGALYLQLGRLEEARAMFTATLDLAREAGDRAVEANALANLGTLARDRGRTDEGLELYGLALAIARETANRRFEGTVLGNLGLLHHDRGTLDAARSHYEAALAIHRESGNRRFEAIILGNLGNLHYHEGRIDEAQATYMEALAIARSTGDRAFEAVVLGNLGQVARDQARVDDALAYYKRSLAILRELGVRRIEGAVLGNYGLLLYEQGQVDEARNAITTGESILRQMDERSELGKLLCTRAEIERGTGNTTAARATLEEVEAIVAVLGPNVDAELTTTLDKLRRTVAAG
jgi:predicted ATPase/tetratricopeptide (TPR) repeat protein